MYSHRANPTTNRRCWVLRPEVTQSKVSPRPVPAGIQSDRAHHLRHPWHPRPWRFSRTRLSGDGILRWRRSDEAAGWQTHCRRSRPSADLQRTDVCAGRHPRAGHPAPRPQAMVNLMFRADGSLAIVDFGIATRRCRRSHPGMAHSWHAAPHEPEQVRGLTLDLRTDIYSAGKPHQMRASIRSRATPRSRLRCTTSTRAVAPELPNRLPGSRP